MTLLPKSLDVFLRRTNGTGYHFYSYRVSRLYLSSSRDLVGSFDIASEVSSECCCIHVVFSFVQGVSIVTEEFERFTW